MDATVELLSPEEAARRLSIGRTYLYELIGKGALPSVRVGRLRRIPAPALREYVEHLVQEQGGARERVFIRN